jgi:hypothetical protein
VGAALRRAIRWPPLVTPSRRRAVWPCARLPITTIAAQPCSRAIRMSALMAARRRPSRWLAGSPASCRGMVTDGPAGLPSGVTI